ncbi:Uma2 family endonuclease [Laspinema sp. D1]|uniref:Uma2 family endonuclease n=1 Tax=Laspinema palackyanum TaxID=3231601 RepID=UPI00349378DD|nr:Uma2 family endonuclease [Laspinema sp. D2b]
MTKAELTPELQTPMVVEDEWTPPMPPTDLIFDDGEPLESNRHRIAMNVLIAAVHEAFAGRQDYFTGGNMFVYFNSEQARNRDFKGPDFFVALNVDGIKERQGWVIWEEEGRYPNVIVELLSPSTAREDLGHKKDVYEQTFRLPEYFVYDPFAPDSLRGWRLTGPGYEELTKDDRGWLWCNSLGFWLGTWEGTLQQETATWLRFFDADGNLILLPEELAKIERQRAEDERQRAEEALSELEALKARLREKGIDLESL